MNVLKITKNNNNCFINSSFVQNLRREGSNRQSSLENNTKTKVDIPEEEKSDPKNNVNNIFQSRHYTYIKNLSDKKKEKEEKLLNEALKQEKKSEDMKKELGVLQINSKFMNIEQPKVLDKTNKLLPLINEKRTLSADEPLEKRPFRHFKSTLKMKSLTNNLNYKIDEKDEFTKENKFKDEKEDKEELGKQISNKRNKLSMTTKLQPKVKLDVRLTLEEKMEDVRVNSKIIYNINKEILSPEKKNFNSVKSRKQVKTLVNFSNNRTSDLHLAQIKIEKNRSKSPKKEEKEVKKSKDKKFSSTQEINQSLKSKEFSDAPANLEIKQLNKERIIKPVLKNCNSLEEWKRRNKIDISKKIFICNSEYPTIINALLERDWVQNFDVDSNFFDLKYIISGHNVDYRNLNKGQVVNHYEKSHEITTKVSLCKNLRNLIWFRNVDIDSFYPRCYDLADPNDLEDFNEEFKTTKVIKYILV